MSCPMCHKEHTYSIPEALTGLAATPRRLEKLAKGFTPRRAGARPVPGKWSAKEIINHLGDCEVVYGFRYRKILAEPGAPLAAFDQERWAEGVGYQKLPLKTSLVSFSALRSQNLAILKLQPAEAWDRAGTHPEYGSLSLRQLVTHLVYHDGNHLSQIEGLAAPPARKTTKKKKPVARRRARR